MLNLPNLPKLEIRPVSRGADTDLLLVAQDGAKKPLAAKGSYAKVVSRFRKGDAFSAGSGSTQFVRFGGRRPVESVLLLGIGPARDLQAEKLRQAGGSAWQKLSAEKSKSVAVHVDALAGRDDSTELLRALAEGLVLGCYGFKKYKTDGDSRKAAPLGPLRVGFVTRDKKLQVELKKQLDQVHKMAEAVNIVRDWSNEPSNYGTPEYFA